MKGMKIMLFEEKGNELIISDEELKERIEKSEYLFRYVYGSFSPLNKNYKSITLVDDYVVIDNSGNKSISKNKKLVDELWATINILMGVIVECAEASKDVPRVKGSYSDEIFIRMKDKSYSLSGRVSDDDLKNGYKNIVSKILEHFDNNN